MPPAVIAGGIAAVGAIGGAVIGSKSQSKAANQANAAQQESAQLQYQLGQQSLALQEKLANQSLGASQGIYNSNYNMLSPFVSRGNVAGTQINAMLGLPSAPVMRSPMEATAPAAGGAPTTPTSPSPSAPAPPAYAGPSLAQIAAMENDGIPGNAAAGQAQYNAYYSAYPQAAMGAPAATSPQAALMASTSAPAIAAQNQVVSQTPLAAAAPAPAAALRMVPMDERVGDRPMLADYATPAAYAAAAKAWRGGVDPAAPAVPAAGGAAPAPAVPAAGGAAVPAAATPSAADAFNTFANSAGAKAMLAAGADSINNLYAAKGALNSGAAMKSLEDYSQTTMLNNYLMPYMSMLGGQQAVGAQAGSAVAGIGSSYGNTVANINSGLANASTGINAGIGGAFQNSADAAANAAIAKGYGQSQLWGTVGSSLGNIASAYAPRPY
jgi:hypothetical protein